MLSYVTERTRTFMQTYTEAIIACYVYDMSPAIYAPAATALRDEGRQH